jgi:phage host-nuclease inhibitor protein Gam
MSELPTEVRVVDTWENLDRALLALRVTEARIAEVSAKFDEDIQIAQEGKSKAITPLVARKERMEAIIKEFAIENRAALGTGRKSIKLVHGKIGFRKGKPKMVLSNGEEHTIRLLKLRGHAECVVVKEEIDKAALKNLPVSEMKLCGISQEQSEAFFYDLATDPPIVYPEVTKEVADDDSPSQG